MVHKMSGKVDAEARSETKSLIESLKNEAKASAAVSNNKMGVDDLREEMKQMVHASFNQMLNSMRNEGVVFRNNFVAGNFSCHRCKQPGHFIRDCPEPPGIQPGQLGEHPNNRGQSNSQGGGIGTVGVITKMIT